MCDRMSEVVKPPNSRETRIPEREFGEWREYRSTSGKNYYYNHVTKKNQWEKPPEWKDETASRPNGHRQYRRPSDRHNGNNANVQNNTPKQKKDFSENDIQNLLNNLKRSAPDCNLKIEKTPKNPKKYWIQENQSKTQTPTGNHQNNEAHNGVSIADTYAHKYKRKRSRVDEFKRAVPELPKLPDISDFETLRPFADPSLISHEVRNLTQGT
jgi:hypothetical protein